MPEKAAEAITPLRDSCYSVPSFKNGDAYDVCADIGMCTWPAGNAGAFCKHQALVDKCFGGTFPNCPALTTDDRHELWEACPSERLPWQEILRGLRRFQQSACYKCQRASGAGRCLKEKSLPQREMSGACPSHEEEPQASSSVLLFETVSSTSGLQHQNTEVCARLQSSMAQHISCG